MGDEESKLVEAHALIDDEIIPELIEAILEMDFKVEVESGHGRVVGFQRGYALANAKSTIRNILFRR